MRGLAELKGEQELEQVEGEESGETGAGFFMVPKVEMEGWAAWINKLYPSHIPSSCDPDSMVTERKHSCLHCPLWEPPASYMCC